MADDGNTRTSEGVQALISRLRDEGVQSGREEAERLVTQAREEAARIVEAARAEAETLRSRATSDAAREREAAIAALRLAERDTVLELRQGIAHLEGREADVLVARALFLGEQPDDPALREQADARVRDFILGITGEMLREGVDLMPADELSGGVRVRLRGDDAELDLSDEAVAELLNRHLLPRFQALLSGAEDAG